MNAQDGAATVDVGQGHVHLAGEPSGPKDRVVQGVHAVGGRYHDDRVGRREAVHLREQLVERLFALVVRVAAAADLREGVDLVDEDDGLAELAGDGEEVAHPLGADPDVHLNEARAGHRYEGDPGLGCGRSGEHRLAGPGRSEQEQAARDAGPQSAEALRELQELDDLGQLELGLITAGDVGEAHRPCDRTGVAVQTADVGRQNDLVVARCLAAEPVPAEDHHRNDEHDPQHGELHDAAQGIGGLGAGAGHAVGRGQLGH